MDTKVTVDVAELKERADWWRLQIAVTEYSSQTLDVSRVWAFLKEVFAAYSYQVLEEESSDDVLHDAAELRAAGLLANREGDELLRIAGGQQPAADSLRDLVWLGIWLVEDMRSELGQRSELSYVDYLRNVTKEARQEIVAFLVQESFHTLINDESVSALIANTYTYGWGGDSFHIDGIAVDDDAVVVSLTFRLSGEQVDDKPFHGDAIEGKATAYIDGDTDIRYEVDSSSLTLNNG